MLGLVLACSRQEEHALPYYNSPDFTPQFLSEQEAAKKITHHIGSFSLINQDNRKMTDKSVDHKIQVASFIFTSCGSICPVMIRNLKPVSKRYRNDPEIIMLFFSVTPWIDTPKKLKDFKKSHQIDNPNWYFLTGKKRAIYDLARRSYFAEEDLGFTKDSTEFLHTEHIVLTDKKQRIRGIYNGTLQTDMQQLVADIGILKNE
ncbi:SCO family protein [Chryseobacterium hagamense]|uniref:SCO family protein n=1 Tax=Chryseobacterium hagamense TaxID=395935 RepID=A0A511YP56_9FLAO|nr:SCO family protein [Chryseobacterium hagamense]